MGVVGALLKKLLLVVEDTDVPMPRPFVHCVALIEPRVRELSLPRCCWTRTFRCPDVRTVPGVTWGVDISPRGLFTGTAGHP
jgi:hypothetical protein